MCPPPKPACAPPAWAPPCWATTGTDASSRTNVAIVKGRRIRLLYADSESEFVKFRERRIRRQPQRTRGLGGIQKQSNHRTLGTQGTSLCPCFVLFSLASSDLLRRDSVCTTCSR